MKFPEHQSLVNNHVIWIVIVFIGSIILGFIPHSFIVYMLEFMTVLLSIVILGDFFYTDGYETGLYETMDYFSSLRGELCKHGYPPNDCYKCRHNNYVRSSRANTKARKELGVVTTNPKPVEVTAIDKPFEERTYLECADLLPEEYREKFIKNIDEDTKDLIIFGRCNEIHEVVSSAFIWNSSPEGNAYWADLHKNLSTKNESV